MGTDFFDGLVKTFSKTTKELGKTTRELGARAEQTIEAQKIRSKITGEERIIEKIKVDIGDIVYRRHSQGDGIDSELSALCQEIDQHYLKIREYKDNAANLKGEKICPSCSRISSPIFSYISSSFRFRSSSFSLFLLISSLL